jgi:hypothetical protein
MKTSFITAALAIVAITVAVALSSCADLAGTSITFDDNGNVVILPPAKGIVIPAK